MADHPTKLGRNDETVLQCLQSATGPLSAYDILDAVKSSGIKAPLQVYRALDKLRDAGLAHRLESLNAFVACADGHCHQSGMVAFAICSDCGLVEEFASDAMKDELGKWAKDHAFAPSGTTIELRGLCAACQTAH